MSSKVRIISFVLAVFMVLFCFVGCCKNESVIDSRSSTNSESTASESNVEDEDVLYYFDDYITDIAYISNGIASFIDGRTGKLGLLNSKCEVMIPAEYASVKYCEAGGMCILTYQDGREVTFDPSTGSLEDGNQCAHGGFESMGWDTSIQKLIIYDMDGSTYECPEEFLPSEEIFVNRVDNRYLWGLVGAGGALVAEPQWEAYGYFGGNADIAPVKKSGHWGYVNRNGDIVINYDYTNAYTSKGCLSYDVGTAYPAIGDYVCLFKDGFYGLYNTNTKEFSDFAYNCLVPISDEYCIAKDSNGKWFYDEYNVIANHTQNK